MPIAAIEPYQPRSIRFLGLWDIDVFRLKAYGIRYGGEHVDPVLIEAARRVASARLNESALDTHHYGVGFVGIHQGKTGNFVFVDWWADENELHHHVYVSESGAPERLRYMTPTGLAACVWDLYLIGHERDVWVEQVLRPGGEPRVEGYLDAVLNEHA